jgi:hypothetical protein
MVGAGQPQVDTSLPGGCHHLGRPAGHPGQHSVEELLGRHLDAAGAQPSGQHRGHPVRPPGDVTQPVRPVVYRVHRGHHGQQYLRGADVAGRLLPADVLLPGLQRQPIRRVAISVPGHPHQPTGHLTLQAVTDGKVGGMRSAKADRHSEALGGADHDVGADLAWWTEQGQRQRVGRDGYRGAALVRLLDEHRVVAHRTGGTRTGQQHAEELTVRETRLGFSPGNCTEQIYDIEFDAQRLGTGGQHGQSLWQRVSVDNESG